MVASDGYIILDDTIVVDTLILMLGDSIYDILHWYGHLLAAGVVPIDAYNPRNTDNPLDVEYRVADRTEETARTFNCNCTPLVPRVPQPENPTHSQLVTQRRSGLSGWQEPDSLRGQRHPHPSRADAVLSGLSVTSV